MSSLSQINNQPLRRSSRIATFIPTSYWTSIGYSECGAQARTNLQLDLKKYYDNDDDDDDTIELIARDSEGAIHRRDYKLHHNDMMLPHWQRFGSSLIGRSTVKDVRLCGFTLPASVLDIILPTFQTMDNLTHLSLYFASLGNEGFLRLSSFLQNNTSLRFLFLGCDKIDDISVVTSFSDAMKNHPNLESISFGRMEFSNIILGKFIEGCCRMKKVTLRNQSESVTAVAEFISSNHHTEELILQNNNISDNDTLSLASALKKNTHLKWLDLRNNKITKEGEWNILNALFDPTNMDSIIESNHICIPYTYYDIQDHVSMRQHMSNLHWELYNIHIKYKLSDSNSIKMKIRRKVVLALCGVDGSLFDLSLLNDLPLQLMPRVLEAIQKHTEIRTARTPQWDKKRLQKDALSRLFHTLRGWELPLLFENLQSPSVKGRRNGKRKRKVRR